MLGRWIDRVPALRGQCLVSCLVVITAAVFFMPVQAQDSIERPGFSDKPLKTPITTPAWFKLSFLELHDDVMDAKKAGKRGIILYFGQKYCPYCKAFLHDNFTKRDIVHYTRKHFDVIAINVKGSRLVTDVNGDVMPENEYAIRYKANFTPTIVFVGTDGKYLLRLVGYQSPYRFMAALEFIADNHIKKMDFRRFLRQVNVLVKPDKGQLAKRSFYMKQPYVLARSRRFAHYSRPLLVIFEQRDCYACDVLHSGALSDRRILNRLRAFDVVQIDIWGKTPVVTPAGKRMKSSAWAEKMNITYTPTLVFFSRAGREIIRVESIIHFNRLAGVLEYVSSGAWKRYRTFLAWRASRKRDSQHK